MLISGNKQKLGVVLKEKDLARQDSFQALELLLIT